MKDQSSFVIDARYIQDHFPGIGRYTFHLIKALARVAPDESFTALHNPALRNTRYDLGALAKYSNVTLTRVNVPTFSLREQFQLPTSAARVFHSPYYIRPYFLRVPSVVTLFDLIPLHFPNDLPSRRGRLTFRLGVWLAARTATRVIAPSAATRQDLLTYLHVQPDKVAVIPLAADARFAPQSESEIARVRAAYSLPDKYVLYFGINKPHKNLTSLVQAWRELPDRSTALVIAGAWDTRHGGALQQAGAEGIGEIRFLHNLPEADLPGLYSGAAVFVMPSLYEGFGLPVLEAMACGAPVIASKAASLPEVVGDAGLLFDPKETQHLAALLGRVLTDSACRDEMRAKSLARAAQFSWERTARETLHLYHSLRNEAIGLRG